MTTGLAFSIENAINQRFEKVFYSKDTIISAITLPKFKLKLQNKKDRYTQMLIDEMRLYANSNNSTEEENVNSDPKGKADKKDFFELGSDDESTSCDTVEVEAARYLSDAKTLDCLDKYLTIKKLFLKYNTSLPSSAPVE